MIKVTGRFARKDIINLLESKIDEICSGEVHEVNKMRVQIRRTANIHLSMKHKDIYVVLPLEFKLLKGEGIFVTEIKGEVEMTVMIHFEIDHHMHIDFNTKLLERRWLNGPTLEIGSLDLPVEKVANLVIDYHQDEILDNVNNTLQTNINRLKYSFLEARKLQELINPYLPSGLYADINRLEVIAETPILDNNSLNIYLLIKPNLHISSTYFEPQHHNPEFLFHWVEKIQSQTLGYIRGEISYEYILGLLTNLINGMQMAEKKVLIQHLRHKKVQNKILLSGIIMSPIEGKLAFSFIPVYNESKGELMLHSFESKVDPDSFLYKLGAPVLNKIIKERIQDIFPWGINRVLDNQIKKVNGRTKNLDNYKFKSQIDVLSIDELIFNDINVSVKMRYEGLTINI